MTKKSNRQAAKFFDDAGRKTSQGAKSVSKVSRSTLASPFNQVGGMVEDATSGPGLYMVIGGALILLVLMNAGSQRVRS